MYKLPQGAQIREVQDVTKPQYKTDPKKIYPIGYVFFATNT